MKKLLLLIILATLVACSESTQDEDTTPPGAPSFAIKGSDTLEVETGIDAASNGVMLHWHLPADLDGDLAGIHIYRSISRDSVFLPLLEFDQPLLVQSPLTSFIDDDSEVRPLEPSGPQRYWYFLRAVDEDGNQSVRSDTASYRLWYPVENIVLQLDSVSYKCHLELYNLDLAIESVLLKFSDGQFYRCITLAEDLQQVMDYNLPVDELPLPVHLDSLRLRVDLMVQDETSTTITSNPNQYPLSGSESEWKWITGQ
jgi:hypothetical protein